MRGPCNPTTKLFGVRPNEEGLQQGPHSHCSLPPFPSNPPKRRGVYHHFTTPPHPFFYVIPSTLGEDVLSQYYLQDTEGKGRIPRLSHILGTLSERGRGVGRRHSTHSNKVSGHISKKHGSYLCSEPAPSPTVVYTVYPVIQYIGNSQFTITPI